MRLILYRSDLKLAKYRRRCYFTWFIWQLAYATRLVFEPREKWYARHARFSYRRTPRYANAIVIIYLWQFDDILMLPQNTFAFRRTSLLHPGLRLTRSELKDFPRSPIGFSIYVYFLFLEIIGYSLRWSAFRASFFSSADACARAREHGAAVAGSEAICYRRYYFIVIDIGYRFILAGDGVENVSLLDIYILMAFLIPRSPRFPRDEGICAASPRISRATITHAFITRWWVFTGAVERDADAPAISHFSRYFLIIGEFIIVTIAYLLASFFRYAQRPAFRWGRYANAWLFARSAPILYFTAIFIGFTSVPPGTMTFHLSTTIFA